MFHLDNCDLLEDTPDGENTSHLLQLSVFQSHINEKCMPMVLDLENIQSLTLIDNLFYQLLDCEAPPKEMIHRLHDCQEFSKDSIMPIKLDSTVGISAPVKNLQLNCFKKLLRITPVELKDCIVQLGDDANIWRKMVIIPRSREIDCNKIISNHELLLQHVSQWIERALCTVDKKGNQNFCLF